MTLGGILLILYILVLIGAEPTLRPGRNLSHLYCYDSCVRQKEKEKEKGMVSILEYGAKGATIRLDQRELLLVMALIQECRESFGCNTDSGRALDELFTSANRLVEEARRGNQQPVIRQKIHLVATHETLPRKDVSHA